MSDFENPYSFDPKEKGGSNRSSHNILYGTVNIKDHNHQESNNGSPALSGVGNWESKSLPDSNDPFNMDQGNHIDEIPRSPSIAPPSFKDRKLSY